METARISPNSPNMDSRPDITPPVDIINSDQNLTDRTMVQVDPEDADEQADIYDIEFNETKGKKNGTLKSGDMFISDKKRVIETTSPQQAPHSVWNSSRKLDQIIIGEALSNGYNDDFDTFNRNSINTQRMIENENESKKTGDPDSLLVSQKESQLQSPRLFKEKSSLKQQVQLKSHINTPQKGVQRPKYLAESTPQKVKQFQLNNQTSQNIPQNSGSYIRIQTNDSNMHLMTHRLSSEPITQPRNPQFHQYSSLMSGADDVTQEQLADESTISLILPHTDDIVPFVAQELARKQEKLNMMGSQHFQDQFRQMSQKPAHQSRSFCAAQTFSGSGVQPGSRYSKKMKAKYRKKVQQTYFTKLSQILMNHNLNNKHLMQRSQQQALYTHETTEQNESSYQNNQASTQKMSTLNGSTVNLSPTTKRDAASSPSIPTQNPRNKEQFKDNYKDRFEQYQQSINQRPVQENDNQQDHNRFIIGRKSIQTDRPASIANDQQQNVEPMAVMRTQLSYQKDVTDANKDINLVDHSSQYNIQSNNKIERHGGDSEENRYESDYNFQVVNHPLMKEYEEKISKDLTYTKKRAEFVSNMMSYKSKQILVTRNHHQTQMAQDLHKITSALDFVTEMHIKQSLQDIIEEKQRSEGTSKPTSANKVVIKTSTKDVRTSIEFPGQIHDILEQAQGTLTDTKTQTKQLLNQDDVYNPTTKTISEAENEAMYLENSQGFRNTKRTTSNVASLPPSISRNIKFTNVYEGKRDSEKPPREKYSEKISREKSPVESVAGETLYQEQNSSFDQMNSPDRIPSYKGSGKLMSNTKLNQFVKTLNKPDRESTMRNLVTTSNNFEIAKKTNFNRNSEARDQEVDIQKIKQTRLSSNQAGVTTSTPPPQSQLLNAVYGQSGYGQSGYGAITDKIDNNTLIENIQNFVGSPSANVFPSINNRYSKNVSEEKQKEGSASPQTLMDGFHQTFERKPKPGVRRLSISNHDQININSKQLGRIDHTHTQMSMNRDSIQRINEIRLETHGSQVQMNYKGVPISLPELGVDLNTYSQMIDTCKNTNNSFRGSKRVFKQHARNTSMILINSTNLADVQNQLLSSSNQAAGIFKRTIYDKSAQKTFTNQRNSMKQELQKLKEIQKLKELKDIQKQNNKGLEKLLQKELSKAHSSACNFKYRQMPGQFKTQVKMTDIENNQQILLLDIKKQQMQKQKLKYYHNEPSQINLDSNRKYFGGSKMQEESTQKLDSKTIDKMMETGSQEANVFRYTTRQSIQLTDITTEEQRRKEQEMQYIINNITEKDVMKLNQNLTSGKNTQKLTMSVKSVGEIDTTPQQNEINVNRIQQLIQTSGSDNTRIDKIGSSEPDKNFISFSRKNTNERFEFNERNFVGNHIKTQKSNSKKKQSSKKDKKNRETLLSQDDDLTANGPRVEEVNPLSSGKSLNKINRDKQNETQLLMNQSSKTSQKEFESPDQSVNAEIENNFSTNLSSKDKLSIVKSTGKLNINNSAQVNTLTQLKHTKSQVKMNEEAANLKDILRKKQEITRPNRTTNNSKMMEESGKRQSSGSQTEMPQNSRQKTSNTLVLNQLKQSTDQDYKQSTDQDQIRNKNQGQDYKSPNQTSNSNPHSVISQVKIYRKGSHRYKSSDKEPSSRLEAEKQHSSPQKQSKQDTLHTKKLQQIAATQFSLSPISVRSPRSSTKRDRESPFENNGVNTFTNANLQNKNQSGVFFPKNSSFGLNYHVQEYLLPKHLSQLSFAVGSMEGPVYSQVLNKDIKISPQSLDKTSSMIQSELMINNIIHDSKLGDTLTISPKMEENVKQSIKKNRKKMEQSRTNVKFAIKSFDQGAHHSMPSGIDISNVIQNLVCKPFNIKQSKKSQKTRNRTVNKYYTGTSTDNSGGNWQNLQLGQSSNYALKQIDQQLQTKTRFDEKGKITPNNAQEASHSNQHIQTSQRGHNSSIQSLHENHHFENYQRGWHDDEIVNMASTSHKQQVLNPKIQHIIGLQELGTAKMTKLSSTTTFQPVHESVNPPNDDDYSSMGEQNGTLDLNTHSKPEQITAFQNHATSVSSLSHGHQNIQNSPQNVNVVLGIAELRENTNTQRNSRNSIEQIHQSSTGHTNRKMLADQTD